MVFKSLYIFITTIFLHMAAYGQFKHNTKNELIKLYGRDEIKGSNNSVIIIKANRPNNFQFERKPFIKKRLSWDLFIVDQRLHKNSEDYTIIENANSLWKVSDNIAELIGRRSSGVIMLKIKINSLNTSDDLSNYGEIIEKAENQVLLKSNVRKIKSIADDPRVEFIDTFRLPKEEVIINDLDLSNNKINYLKSRYPAIKGDGITVSIKENKFNDSDIDLLSKGINTGLESSNSSPHATIMATIIGGMGNSFIKGLGVAPKVSLGSSDFKNLNPDNINSFKSTNTFLQNHSYGTVVENYYGNEAALYDKQVFEYESLVHVFSSGNIGTSSASTGIYKGIGGWANLSGNFKQAKNTIVIGSVTRDNIVPDLSSRGPAFDGRIKPELVANSTDGTSGAAALATGTIALLQQTYFEIYHHYPSVDIIKALLVCTANNIDSNEASYTYGFGKLDGDKALGALKNKHFFINEIGESEEYSQRLVVPHNTKKLIVSLAWNDPPAPINTTTALVNDLDMVITDAARNTYQPWILKNYPSSDSLRTPPKQGIDSLNNLEKVSINEPVAGVYMIKVKGHKAMAGRQKFSIAYDCILKDQFHFSYPASQDELIASQSTYIRWENTFVDETGMLSISYDNGINWTFISPVKLSLNYRNWLCPNVFSKAILRMEIGDVVFTSQPFTISAPLTLKVGFNCSDDISLNWSKQVGSSAYELYNLDGDSLKLLSKTTDTILTFKKNQISSNIFAIRAVSNDFKGIRGYATDINKQGVGCYVQSFLADVVNEHQVLLTLRLGTVSGLKGITWQRKVNNSFVDVSTTTIDKNIVQYKYNHNSPNFGIQYYRILLKGDNDQIISTELASVIVLRSDQFELYPNPVTDNLNILNGTNQYFNFKLYTIKGEEVRSEKFHGRLSKTSLQGILPGLYVVEIQSSNGIRFISKLIKQ